MADIASPLNPLYDGPVAQSTQIGRPSGTNVEQDLALTQRQAVKATFGVAQLLNWLGSVTRAPFWTDAGKNELLGADSAPADGASFYRGHLIDWLRSPFFSSQIFKRGAADLYTVYKWLGNQARAPFWIDRSGNELLGADAAPSNGWSYYRGHFIGWLFSNAIAKRLTTAGLPTLAVLFSWNGSRTRSPGWIDQSLNLLLGANSAPADGVSYYEGHFVDYIIGRSGGAAFPYSPVALASTDRAALPSSSRWLGMIVYGQSLSVGAKGQPVLTATQPYANLTFTGGLKSSSASDRAGTRALYEDALGEDNATGTDRGETSSSTAANFATKRFIVNNGGAPTDFVVFASNPGRGGTAIAGLTKGTAPYNRMMSQITSANASAIAAGKTFVVNAIPYIQSETDADNSVSGPSWLTSVKQFVVDLNTDIKAITGQTTPVHLLLCQTAYKSATQSQIALAQLQAVRESPLIHLVVNYGFLPYNSDKTHSTNVGYAWLGHYIARAFYQLTALGQKPDCIMPLSATFNGSALRVKFRTPTRLKLPSVATQTGWGFKVSDDTGTHIVTAATVMPSGDEVVLTLNRAVTTNPQVRYSLDYLAANNITGGAAGDLTDSTTETATISGASYSLAHRAPAFQLAAYFVEA